MNHRIERATYSERNDLALLIAHAFFELPAARWLVPEPEHRTTILAGHFEIIVEHAFFYGHIDVTTDRTAVAVWFDRTSPVPPPADYTQRLTTACGPYTERFHTLDQLFDTHHPRTDHHHLALLAVTPDHQRAGRGSALLNHHHTRLDETCLPAYLEASSTASRDLYLRHGYHQRQPFTLPNNAPFWPMTRTPR